MNDGGHGQSLRHVNKTVKNDVFYHTFNSCLQMLGTDNKNNP